MSTHPKKSSLEVQLEGRTAPERVKRGYTRRKPIEQKQTVVTKKRPDHLFKPGTRGPGRAKGQVNRVTQSVKDAMVEAFDKLGGVPALVRWGKRDPGAFYKLWARLLPIQITGANGGPIEIIKTKIDLSKYSVEELQKLAELVEKGTLAKAAQGCETIDGVVIRLKDDKKG